MAESSQLSSLIKGGYYPSWALSFFPPSSINTNLFTHIYYAFLNPDATSFQFNNIDQQTQAQLSNFTSTLHAANPPVKVLFSVGGGSADSSLFSNMASDSSSRKRFIDSSIDVARTYGFDGIDLDWELPENPADMLNLGSLLDEWRAAVNRDAAASRRSPLLLVAAVYYASNIPWKAPQTIYPSASISKNLDWINIMTYDYHGSWEPSVTGAHAALFSPNDNLSTSYGIMSWIQAGVPTSKLIMGLPLYGRTWRLTDPSVHGIGAPADGVGPGQDGAMTYADVVSFNRANNAQVVYDTQTVSIYSVAGTSWITYDDGRSVTEKVKYARNKRLGGYFFWAVNGDDQWTISQTASDAWAA